LHNEGKIFVYLHVLSVYLSAVMKVFCSFRAVHLKKKDQAVTEKFKVVGLFSTLWGKKEVKKVVKFSLCRLKGHGVKFSNLFRHPNI